MQRALSTWIGSASARNAALHRHPRSIASPHRTKSASSRTLLAPPARSGPDRPMTSPLKGVRVFEVGQFIAGPYCGMQLADLGADVIKIERPDGGDPFRVFGAGGGAQGYSSNFTAFNRNKRSLSINLGDKRGQALFKK